MDDRQVFSTYEDESQSRSRFAYIAGGCVGLMVVCFGCMAVISIMSYLFEI